MWKFVLLKGAVKMAHGHHHGFLKKDKDTALLEYMLEHNRHHAQELTELAENLAGSDKGAAAELIGGAVAFFEKGNAELEKALEALKA